LCEAKNRRPAFAGRREPNPIQKIARLNTRRVPADSGGPFCLRHEGEGDGAVQNDDFGILYLAWLELQQAIYQHLKEFGIHGQILLVAGCKLQVAGCLRRASLQLSTCNPHHQFQDRH
jgi:hypothetical protein